MATHRSPPSTTAEYRRPGHANLHPADAALNLPAERHSHGLRRLAAVESTRGSFEEAAGAVARATGTQVGKRQIEELTAAAAADVDAFYAAIERELAADGAVLIISANANGIVMRPGSLRPATERAAAAATTKLEGRLSQGREAQPPRWRTCGTSPLPGCHGLHRAGAHGALQRRAHLPSRHHPRRRVSRWSLNRHSRRPGPHFPRMVSSGYQNADRWIRAKVPPWRERAVSIRGPVRGVADYAGGHRHDRRAGAGVAPYGRSVRCWPPGGRGRHRRGPVR